MSEKIRKILETIWELYNVSTEGRGKMMSNADEYEKAFEPWTRDEVILGIRSYFRYKNDKTRPNIAQIAAMLPDRRTEIAAKSMQKPETAIENLQRIFDDVVILGHKLGVWSSEWYDKEGINSDASYRMEYCKKRGKSAVYPCRFFFQDAVTEAKQRYPDQYALYPHMEFAEACALAYSLGILTR